MTFNLTATSQLKCLYAEFINTLGCKVNRDKVCLGVFANAAIKTSTYIARLPAGILSFISMSGLTIVIWAL